MLGVGYGASPEEASAAFARLSRRLRRSSDAPFTLEDATWALHQLETADGDAHQFAFRVPADRRAYELPDGHGLFDPAPAPLARRTERSGQGLLLLEAEAVADTASAVLAPLVEPLLERPPPAPTGPVWGEEPRAPRQSGVMMAVAVLIVLAAIVGLIVLTVGPSEEDDTAAPAPVATPIPTATPAPSPTPSPTPLVVDLGAAGFEVDISNPGHVEFWQQILVGAGQDVSVDGVWGQQTEQATRTLQAELGIEATGIPDAATVAAALDAG
ncbi:MAG: peptidoglycan-binding domain-containing protein [Acidimicrobiales bacterium]